MLKLLLTVWIRLIVKLTVFGNVTEKLVSKAISDILPFLGYLYSK